MLSEGKPLLGSLRRAGVPGGRRPALFSDYTVRMFAALNTAAYSTIPADEMLVAVQAAGFAGVELALSADGPIRYDDTDERLAALGNRARELGLRVVGLSGNHYRQAHFASPQPHQRALALDYARRMIVMAAAAGAGSILLIPAFVGGAAEKTPTASYADALNQTFEALSELRHEAERAGVAIVLENAWNRFLLSPVEVADLLDRLNSPAVGWCLDTGNLLATGYPQDWIATLAGRISRVHIKDFDLSKPGRAGFCGLGEGNVDWAAVREALMQAGYSGPLTYEGGGEMSQIRARMRELFAV